MIGKKKAPKPPSITGEQAVAMAKAAAPKGIAMLRDRPRGSGWCGTEGCKHRTHAHYSEPATATAQ